MAKFYKILSGTLIALLGCMLLVYTSCKKTEVTKTTQSTNTQNTSDIARQIAQNFYKSLTGSNSGININDGLNPSLNIKTNSAKHVLNSTQNALCGYTIDTSYNSASRKGDTTSTSSGSFKFTYTCSSADVDGYKSSVSNNSYVTDSLTFRATNTIAQTYVVTATDNTYKKLLANGNINTTSNYGILGNGGAITTGFYYTSAQYVMTNVMVDLSSGTADAVSGSATFNMLIVNEPPTTPQTDGNFYGYSGSITYLGNHMARVAVNIGNNQYKNYLVNMVTGATTAL
jgi:hypothetical protein